MVHPLSQSVTANEGEPLDIIVEFCAEPSYTKVLWISEERVYTPDAPSHDGVQALAIEVNLHVLLHRLRVFATFPYSRSKINVKFGLYKYTWFEIIAYSAIDLQLNYTALLHRNNLVDFFSE